MLGWPAITFARPTACIHCNSLSTHSHRCTRLRHCCSPHWPAASTVPTRPDERNVMSIEGKTLLAGMAATLLVCSAARAAESAATPDSACAQLRSQKVPASAITLSTAGAVVTSATQIEAGVSADKVSLPAYCKVLGSIAAVDPTAPPIQFELDLPTTWNKKLLMLGGGGFNG